MRVTRTPLSTAPTEYSATEYSATQYSVNRPFGLIVTVR